MSEGLLWVLGPWKLKELFLDRALATLESILSSQLHWFVIRVVGDRIGLPCWSCCIFPKGVIMHPCIVVPLPSQWREYSHFAFSLEGLEQLRGLWHA